MVINYKFLLLIKIQIIIIMISGNVLKKDYWCFMCTKEISPKEQNNALICSICSSEFIEEIDENDEHPNKFKPEIKENTPSNTLTSSNSSNNSLLNNSRNPNNFPHFVSNSLVSNFNFSLGNNGGVAFSTNAPPNFQVNAIGGVISGMFNNIFGGFNNYNIFNQNLDMNIINGNRNGISFDQLLNNLFIEDTQNRGNPPAAKDFISSLEKIAVNKENLDELSLVECCVCMEHLKEADDVAYLPCKHCFHFECVVNWLNQHNTCPVCRTEFKTDNPDYENRRNNSNNNRRGTNNINNGRNSNN